MMSIFGEQIITESRRVGEAAFLSKWHDIDEKAKKTILIIMIRSHKYQKLTAYKFSVISYGSFTKVSLRLVKNIQYFAPEFRLAFF
ncbi:unnamed protein product [Diatraea saccharalis]|uniref:Uncharacterized protein n=1 Tax=Diatraea saccharalis TaxID=40085 RepID=A0A9N9WGL0_9NEOP|nr:unnamed protein product [Diatraea saccharalis]